MEVKMILVNEIYSWFVVLCQLGSARTLVNIQ